jgi:DNA-binding NarL/FixJ family response regulator
MNEPRMTRVLVADDFPLVREALATALRRHPEIEVVAMASDGVEAIEMAHAHRPDVVVLDLKMPRMSGLVALTKLSSELPSARVLLLTACEEPDTVIDAVSAGAAGFITKRSSGADLIDAVLRVARGEPVISASLTAYLVQGLRRENGERRGGTTGSLTSSELNVLRLVADGRTDKQISSTLYISPRTVQSHLAQIRTKTGVRRRTQLARWATEHLVT